MTVRTPAFAATKTVRISKLFRGLILVAAVLAACLCPALAFGQTNSTWNGGTGNWSTSTDWTPNQVPNNGGGNTYNVTIGSNGPDTVTLNQNATVASLTLGDVTGSHLSQLTSASGAAEDLTVTGSLTLNKQGWLFMNSGSNITAANVTSSGLLALDGVVGDTGTGSTLTVTGTYTNNFYGGLWVANGDVANIGAIVNNGVISVGTGSTLNLTNQPNGITDIPAGSVIELHGSFNAGSNSALANLASIEGNLQLWNGESLNLTPTVLTVASGAQLSLAFGASLTVTDLISDTTVSTGNSNAPSKNSLTVSGTFGNYAGGILNVGMNGAGIVSIGLLVNDSTVNISSGSTLAVASIAPTYKSSKINVNANGELDIEGSSVTLAGHGPSDSGSLTLSGGMITGGSASDVLTNDIIITGYGVIGDNSMGLVNSSTGTILVSGKGNLLTIDPSSAGFNNEGKLNVGSGATIDITGATNSFLNFNSATGTLTGGSYGITNGTLQFDNANIVTNAAKITLSGPQSLILNQNGGDGLANFAFNASAGSFTLEGNRNFTTSGGFTNAGNLTISAGSTFTVGGINYFTQTAGTTTVRGTLTVAPLGSFNLSGGSILDIGEINTGTYTQKAGTTNVSGNLNASSNYTQSGGTTIVSGHLTAGSAGGVNISGGSVFGTGTITGNIDLTGGLLSAGSASKKAGELTLKGAYAQSGAGAFDVDLGGTTAGTQYDVVEITSTASLGGTLNVDLISGFTPTVGETFDIMDYTSETGTFTTLNLPKLTGGDTWSISYNSTGVVLTVDGPGAAAAPGAVNGSPAKRVSRGLIAGAAADGWDKTVAILARAGCFGARLLTVSAACGSETLETIAIGGERRATASAGIGSGAVHNNIMVATRAISGARGGAAGRESSASAAAMARLYVCAYLPASVGHAMGCN